MSNLNLHNVKSYDSALLFLNGRESKRLAYQTTVHDEGACITVRYFDTAIVRYWQVGPVEIRNGGYFTKTTTDRMHRLTPSDVFVSGRGFEAGSSGNVISRFYSGPQTSDWQQVA